MKKNETLANLISNTREKMGYSQSGLASRANIELDVIERIESGQELFLSPTIRQKLAMALKLSGNRLKSLEKQIETGLNDFKAPDKVEELRLRILYEGEEGHLCPVCGSELICRVAVMYDLEDNPVKHPKARCSKCPFQIK